MTKTDKKYFARLIRLHEKLKVKRLSLEIFRPRLQALEKIACETPNLMTVREEKEYQRLLNREAVLLSTSDATHRAIAKTLDLLKIGNYL